MIIRRESRGKKENIERSVQKRKRNVEKRTRSENG
jgi:hypothetical protein